MIFKKNKGNINIASFLSSKSFPAIQIYRVVYIEGIRKENKDRNTKP